MLLPDPPAIRPGLTPFSTRTLPCRTPRSNVMAAHADLGQDKQGIALLLLRQDVASSEAQLRERRTTLPASGTMLWDRINVESRYQAG